MRSVWRVGNLTLAGVFMGLSELVFCVLVLSAVDLMIAPTMANRGFAMAPLPLAVIGATLAGPAAFPFLADFVKVPVFRHLEIR